MSMLPDVPEDEYNRYRASQFQQANEQRIGAMSFGLRNQARIDALGYEIPEQAFGSAIPLPQLPQIPLPQLPALPQLPQQAPAPAVVPPPSPPPVPEALPPAPLLLPPTPAPTPPPQVTPPQPPGVQGQLTPTVPLVPTVPGGQLSGTAGPPSTWGAPVAPQPSPFADQTSPISTPSPSTTNVPVGGDLRAYARQAASRAGVDPDIFVAQIQQESGFSPTAKSPAGAIGIAQFMPGTAAGLNLDPTDPYAALEAAAQMDARHLKQYGGDWAKVLAAYNAGPGAVEQYGGVPPYKETQSYVSSILGNAGKSAVQPDLQSRAPLPPGAPPTAGTALSTSQFGDRQLSSDEAYAACGPAAAVRFAQAYGRNPTLREATDLAASVGWTPAAGMAGIGSEQKLLEKLGIPTRLVGANIGAMATEASTGNPITISTPGHYFYADGYNPQTGAFHVGQSGLDLKGGAEWMTPAQMEARMGAIQGALFADNPQAPAPSTAHPPADYLNQQKQAAMQALNPTNWFTTPQQTRPQPQNPNDPQVQQLEQAVQYAHTSQPPATGAQDTRSTLQRELDRWDTATADEGSPLDQLGSAIGGAIQRALSSVLGGGPPPPPGGGEEDRKRRDDLYSRTRQELERFNELPGGHTLQDIGAPEILPPDFSGKSPGDAVLAAVEAAGQKALNRQSPLPGPGGLGVYDPRLGADPRLEIPPFLDPLEAIGELIHRVRGTEGVTRALGEAFDTARAAAPAGGPVAGVLPSNVGTPSIVRELATRGESSINASLERNGVQGGWDAFVRQFYDRNVDVNHIGEALRQRLGRPLTDEENVALQIRFDPTHQASAATEIALGPALRAIPGEALNDYYDLQQHYTNKSIGEGLAKQVEQQYLEGGVPQSMQQRLEGALQDWNAAQDAVNEAEAVAANPRTRDRIGIDAAQRRVENARAQLEAAAEVARQVNSEAAAERVTASPNARLVTNAESRDLIIAEENARKLNERYDRLFGRDPENPYVETLGRQVGRAEDRAARLRAALGERSGARSAAIEQRAQGASETAFAQQPRYNPTPQYAAANVRLRYEQRNLERLQTAQARGRQGLQDEVGRAEKRVQKALEDVQQAQQDLPAAAQAQGWAQLTGRKFQGQSYDQVLENIRNLETKYADQPETWRAMQDARQAVRNFREQLLQEQVDSGLVSQDTADNLRSLYPDWTPTRQLDYIGEDGGPAMARGSRLSVNDTGLHPYTLEGSQGEAMNPVAALLKEADRTYALGNRNRVVNQTINATRGEGGPLRRIADTLKEYIDAGGESGALLHPDYTPRPGRGESKISAFVEGKKQEYVTDNPYLKQAIEQAGVAPDAVSRAASKLTNLMRETAVSRNPLWLAGNSLIDAAGYSIGTTAAGGFGRNLPSMALNLGPALATAAATSNDDPNRGQKIAGAAIAGVATRALMSNKLGLGPSAMREFLRAYGDVLQGLGSGRMTGQGARELELAGGGMRGGNFFGGGVQEAEKRLSELTRKNAFQIRNADDAKKLLSDAAAFGWVKALGNRFEQAPRIAAYRVARQRGETQLEAMARARDVTIDFDRGGQFAKALNHWIPFFNAGMQGGAQFARLWKRDPAAMALAGVSLVGLPTVAAEMWNRSDPQRSKDYDNVPQYLKDQGVVVMLPGEAPVDKNGNRMPQHIDMNLREFAPFAIAAREGYDRISGEGAPRGAGELAGAGLSALSPLNVRNPLDATYGLLPAPIGTVGALSSNRDPFRGTTIANRFSDENASALGKLLAPHLEDAVTSYVPGGETARIHPSQVDFVVRDMLNGLGSSALGASDVASGTPPRAPGLLSDLPVVGSGLGRFVRGTGGQSWQDVSRPDQLLQNDIRQRLRDLGSYYEPSAVPSDIQRIPLRRDEQTEYQRLTNQYFDQYLRRAMDMPSFSKSEAARTALITKSMDAARQKAGAEVVRQLRASGSNPAQRVRQQSSAL